jgi:hypothetical protein
VQAGTEKLPHDNKGVFGLVLVFFKTGLWRWFLETGLLKKSR